MGIWISGWTLGNSADELLGWYDNYADKTKTEGTDKKTGDVDIDGTAIENDLLYHSITAGYSYVVLTAIMVGGYIFTYNFATFTAPLAACDLENVDKSKYAPIKNGFENLSNGNYTECLTQLQQWFTIIDLNNDQTIDRCEDAQFLFGVGNTEEYSINYSGSSGVNDMAGICMYVVPTAFDDVRYIEHNSTSPILNIMNDIIEMP